jgi:hypothetical protein
VLFLFALERPADPKYPRPTHRNAGDWDKLARAVGDDLKDAGVIADDGLITDGRVVKDYPGPRVLQTTPGALVRIWHDTDDGLPDGQLELLERTNTDGSDRVHRGDRRPAARARRRTPARRQDQDGR